MNRNIVVYRLVGFAVTLAVFATPSVAIGDPPKAKMAPAAATSGAVNAAQAATQSAVRDARDAASRRAERNKPRTRTHLSGAH